MKFFLALILLAPLDIPLVLFLVTGKELFGGGFFVVFSCHLLGSLLSLFFFPSRFWGRTVAFFVFFLPGLGWLFSLVLYLSFHFAPARKEDLSSDWEPLLDIGDDFPLPKLQERFERVTKEIDLLPLADILEGSDEDLKRGAVEKLAELKSPEAIGILLDHRRDPVPEIRFYVTSALTRIRRELDEELSAARREMREGKNRQSGRWSLANVYFQCARSGLFDEVTGNSYEEEAIFHLKDVIRSHEGGFEMGSLRLKVFERLIECYHNQRQWDQALDLLELLEKKGEISAPEIARKKAALFFEKGEYLRLTAELSRLSRGGERSPEWVALCNWWGVGA